MLPPVSLNPPPKRKMIAVGELLVDLVSSAPDVSLKDAPGFVKAPGGAPANVAVAAGRLGLATAFVGKVGTDAFGDFLEETVREAGVDTSGLVRSVEARTTLAFIATRSDGRKDIAFYRNPGADMLLTPDELPKEALAECRCLHFGSVSLSQEPARSATLAAARLARDDGALISFDPNWRPALWDDHEEARTVIRKAMRLAHVVKLADEEMEFVMGTDDASAAAQAVLDAGPALCFITHGPGGASFLGRMGSGFVEGYSVDVVDTLGAGDAFMGAVLAEIVNNRDPLYLSEGNLHRITRRGNAAGAITCTKVGVIPSLPTMSELDTFLAGKDSER